MTGLAWHVNGPVIVVGVRVWLDGMYAGNNVAGLFMNSKCDVNAVASSKIAGVRIVGAMKATTFEFIGFTGVGDNLDKMEKDAVVMVYYPKLAETEE